MQLIGVFPFMNTADNIYIPWFRVTLMDVAFILLFHRFQTIFDRIKTAICCDWNYLTNAIKTRTVPSDFQLTLSWKCLNWPKSTCSPLVLYITCLSNSTSFLAVMCPCKNQEGWPFWCPYGNVEFFFIYNVTVHRVTNSKPQVNIRLAIFECDKR